MEFRLQLASNGLGGRVTNPVTGETYPCTWEVAIDKEVQRDWEPRTGLPSFVLGQGITVDIIIDIDPGFFGSRRHGAGPDMSRGEHRLVPVNPSWFEQRVPLEEGVDVLAGNTLKVLPEKTDE